MLTPVALATWISICTPWAEPRLMASLVMAGSEGAPYLVSDSSGKTYPGKSQADATLYLRKLKSESESFIGLTQIPASKMQSLGLHPELGLDICFNLELGYYLFVQAYAQAGKVEKSPWKTISVAYSVYRSGQVVVDSPFARKATDYLMSGAYTEPAPMNSPLRHGIIAEWSSAMATRVAGRYSHPRFSPLLESAAISEWARRQY